jgi:hypothetical protein
MASRAPRERSDRALSRKPSAVGPPCAGRVALVGHSVATPNSGVDVQGRRSREGGYPGGLWSLPLLAGVAGFATGAGLAGIFIGLHSNWERIPGVSSQATSTVPYWLVQLLGPVLVSVCWTILVLHARCVLRWRSLAFLNLALQLALLAVGLVPIAIAGNGGVQISNFALPLLLLVALAAPVAGALWPGGHKLSAVGWHFAAAATFPVALLFGQSLWASQTLLI